MLRTGRVGMSHHVQSWPIAVIMLSVSDKGRPYNSFISST